MVGDSKFYRLRRVMDLQAEINELEETNRLLAKLEARYQKRGKKRLTSKLTQAQESLDALKETLQKNLVDGINQINEADQ